VRGIQCAFTGKLGQDAELKTSKSGKSFLAFNVAVDEAGRRRLSRTSNTAFVD
jgi:hypothetical protein